MTVYIEEVMEDGTGDTMQAYTEGQEISVEELHQVCTVGGRWWRGHTVQAYTKGQSVHIAHQAASDSNSLFTYIRSWTKA